MKKAIPFKIWELLYPLGIYYVVATISMFIMELLLGQSNENYMICQIVASCITIPFIYRFYRQDQILAGIEKPERFFTKGHVVNALWIIVIAACFGIGLNNVIQMSPLVEASVNYKNVSKAFYGSTIALELLGSAVVTPLLEELMYRGILFGRMRKMMGLVPSLLLSSLIFAIMHFNLVQFLYALLLGMVIAMCMEKSGHMYGAVIAHMTANAIAVIRTETGFLQNTVDRSNFSIVFSVGCLVLGFLLFAGYWNIKEIEK